MRRCLLLATLLLTGCSGSGFWRYEEDTLTLPWQNPNLPVSSSDNFVRARHGSKYVSSQQMLTEAGDIWPGPTAPVPTLKDLQQQQLAEINNSSGVPGQGLAPLPPLPSLPGFEISNQEPGHAAPSTLFLNGGVGLPGGRNISTAYGPAGGGAIPPPGSTAGLEGATAPSHAAGTDNGNIVVPNGNGTSTVISPTGKVTTIPTPK